MITGGTYIFYPLKWTGEDLMAGEGGYWVNKSKGNEWERWVLWNVK